MYFCLSEAKSMMSLGDISEKVLNTSFSSLLKKSKCCTEPLLSEIDFHTSGVFFPRSFNRDSNLRFLLVVTIPFKSCTNRLLIKGLIPPDRPFGLVDSSPDMKAVDLWGATII